MLVLTRKKGQALMIGDDIEITVLETQGDQIRIGIKAPKDITVLRKELYLDIREENRQALQSDKTALDDLARILKKQAPE